MTMTDGHAGSVLDQAIRRTASRAHLKRREQQIVELAVRGLTQREMAESLHLSVHTIRTYVRSILHKLRRKSLRSVVCDIVETIR